MQGILGTKIGMTRILDENGISIPITIVKMDSCWIVNKKNVEKDGYISIVLGYGEKKRANKPYTGIFKNVGNNKVAKKVREFKLDGNTDDFKIGQEINVDFFAEGQYVDVSAISKGHGFAGAMKRHGFGGLPASHGHGEYRRAPGSMSASSYPSRVFKGKKLPGHMGNRKVTVQKLKVVKVDAESRLILIRGAVPGVKNTCITIKKTTKSEKK
ncbi:50S ribosomal protein L3 [bacterium]